MKWFRSAALFLALIAVPANVLAQDYPPLPQAREGQKAATVGGKVYVLGGQRESSGSCAANLAVYDPASRRWLTGPVMPVPRSHFGMAIVQGNLYVAGGKTDDGLTASAGYYDAKKRRWSAIPELPEARFEMAAARLNEKFYVTGGSTDFEPDTVSAKRVYMFDPEEGEWVRMADMPLPMRNHGLVALDGKLYAIGGAPFDSTENAGNQVLSYDPKKDTWTRVADLPTPRADFGVAVFTGRIYVFGGAPDLKVVEVYDPTTDSWTKAPDLPIGRSGASAVPFGDEILLVGGQPNRTVAYIPPEELP